MNKLKSFSVYKPDTGKKLNIHFYEYNDYYFRCDYELKLESEYLETLENRRKVYRSLEACLEQFFDVVEAQQAIVREI